MKLPGYIALARRHLRYNRARTYSTMLGIIIGVASVILILAIGNGVKTQLKSESAALGPDVVTIRPSNNNGFLQASSANLTDTDVAAVQRINNVKTVTPLANVAGTINTDDVKNVTANVVAANDAASSLFASKIDYGTFFDTSLGNPDVAVVGESVAGKLFKEEAPLGRTFTFRGQTFVVQGILKQYSDTPLSNVSSLNDTIFIPYGTALSLTNHNVPAYEIVAQLDDVNQAPQTVRDIESALQASHGGQKDFVVNMPGADSARDNSLNMLTMAMGGIAAISLLVAGIGVMNVMLVSVTERMHEIGIRKAIGATNRQILNQFMTEAAVLSISGCIAGVIIAFIANGALRLTTDLRPVITWQAVAISFGVTLVIGLLFGSAPAIKAARKDPISALRSE